MINDTYEKRIEQLKSEKKFKRFVNSGIKFAKLNYIESKIDYELIKNEKISIDSIINCNIVSIINNLDNLAFRLDVKNSLKQELLDYQKSIGAQFFIKNKIYPILTSLFRIKININNKEASSANHQFETFIKTNSWNLDTFISRQKQILEILCSDSYNNLMSNNKHAINVIRELNIALGNLNNICSKSHYQLVYKCYQPLSHKYSKLEDAYHNRKNQIESILIIKSLLQLNQKILKPLFKFAKQISEKELEQKQLECEQKISWINQQEHNISMHRIIQLCNEGVFKKDSTIQSAIPLENARSYLMYHMNIQKSVININNSYTPEIDQILISMLERFRAKFMPYTSTHFSIKHCNFNILQDKDNEVSGTKFLLYAFYYFCMFIINLQEEDLIKAQQYLEIANIKEHIHIECYKKQKKLKARNTNPKIYAEIDNWITKELNKYIVNHKITKKYIRENSFCFKKTLAKILFPDYIGYCHYVSDKKYLTKNIEEFCQKYETTLDRINTENKIYENFTKKLSKAIKNYIS